MDYYFVSTNYTAFIQNKCCHDVTALEHHIELRSYKEDPNSKFFVVLSINSISQTYNNAYSLILENFRISKREKSNYYKKLYDLIGITGDFKRS